MIKIAVFVGSLQINSVNKNLAKAIEQLAPDEVEFDYVDISLPLLNQDLETDFPATVTAAKAIVEVADGVLFVTPEYNHNIPGVLKNAIDWVTRPSGDNSFAGKPAGIVGASPTPGGTRNVQPKLRDLLVYLRMNVLEQPELCISNAHEVFDENGIVEDRKVEQEIANYTYAFIDWVNAKEIADKP